MSIIRTVLGDVPPDSLGRVDYHEHLFQMSKLLPGDELDDPTASEEEAVSLKRSGFDAMIDATPIGLGRMPASVASISSSTGLSIVATTGAHREAHYPDGHWLRDTDVAGRTALLVRDLEDGMPSSDDDDGRAPAEGSPRAGMLKAGIGYWSITPFERVTLDAVAAAHVATGAPVMVHLEFCTAAHEVLDLLAASGVPSGSVVLAHADRDPDPALHLELAARGAFLGYDGMARPRTRSDAELLDLTAAVVEGNAGDSILLGGDVARRTRYLAYGGMPGLEYLGRRYLPRLRERIGDSAVDTMLTTNAHRLLTWAQI